MTVAILIVCMLLLIVGAIIIAVVMFSEQDKKYKKLEAERDKANELAAKALNEAAAAEAAAAEAAQIKQDARTGDHSRDLDFMADKLHDYAAAGTADRRS